VSIAFDPCVDVILTLEYISGGQRCRSEPRRPHRSLRARGELLQAPRDLFLSATNRRDDRHNSEDHDRGAEHLRDRNEGNETGPSECVALANHLIVANLCPENFLKTLIGKKDLDDALKRLDKLTQDEARMAAAEILKFTHIVMNGMSSVSVNGT
jgi:hypothetical protein